MLTAYQCHVLQLNLEEKFTEGHHDGEKSMVTISPSEFCVQL
jgi:hypothetical protein